MMATGEVAAGDQIICADGEPLGTVQADEVTHLRVLRDDGKGIAWLPKIAVRGIGNGVVRLWVGRDDLHDSVIGLSPGRQREFLTLEGLSILVHQAQQGLRPLPDVGDPSAPPVSPGGSPD